MGMRLETDEHFASCELRLLDFCHFNPYHVDPILLVGSSVDDTVGVVGDFYVSGGSVLPVRDVDLVLENWDSLAC
jgi:hypothetical protein